MVDQQLGPIDVALCCDLPVGVVRWTGAEPRLTVVVKASFTLGGEVAWLSPQQVPLAGDRASPIAPDELAEPSDFAPYKARADVLIVGAAHAREMVWAIPVGFTVGALRRDCFAVASAPSMAIPLSEVYLRSGPAPDAAVVRVGPRSARSPARAALAGADWAFFNAAPPEQQVDVIAEDEVIELRGLLRGAPFRRVALPGMRPRVHLIDHTGQGRMIGPVALCCDTLLIDTDAATCSLTWRGNCDLGGLASPCLLVDLERAGAEGAHVELGDALSRAVWTVAAEPPADQDQEEPPPPPRSRAAPVRLGRFRLGAPAEEPAEPAVFVAPPTPLVVSAPPVVAPPVVAAPPVVVPPPVVAAPPVVVPPPVVVAPPAVALPLVRPPPAATLVVPPAAVAPSVAPLPFAPPAFAPAPLPYAAPEPAAHVTREPADERGAGLSISVFAAVQAALWTRRVPLAEAVAPHGIDEAAYRAAAPALLADLAAEARAGRADRLLDLTARLRRAQEAP